MSLLTSLKRKSDKYNKVVKACTYILLNEDIASNTRNYLEKRMPKKYWEQYGLGYFPKNSELSILLKLVSKRDLGKAGVLYPKRPIGIKGHFSDHNLLMPFHDVHNNIISLLGRSLLTDDEREASELQKYKYSKGARKGLYVYGLNKARESIISSNSVICIEGQFDHISCHNEGIYNVVALGGSAMSVYQFFQIHRYTNNIILMMDNDEAGDEARDKIKGMYGNVANIKVAKSPYGYKDIDEFLRKENDVEWRKEVIQRLQSA